MPLTDPGGILTSIPTSRLDIASAITTDIEGGTIRDVDEYTKEWREGFDFEWVDEEELTHEESEVWDLRYDLLEVVDDFNSASIEEIRISETVRSNRPGADIRGLWESGENRIVIHRSVLQNPAEFIGVFLHEQVIH